MSFGVGNAAGERELDLDQIFHRTKTSRLTVTKVGSVWTKVTVL